ncbi:MAG TPA: Qat anti-phage system TatD family nuclease QatD [Verrucomicrobiae bacterium]|nr:Qat anti-phage system TatD family nuclease QatD [Verrucomicrobiae bacterium]
MHQPLVDFHCHLDLYRNHEAIFQKCRRDEVEILSVTTTPRAWSRNLELTAGAPNIRIALGLHPQLVAEGMDELSIFQKYLPETKYVGEVGLDASPRFYKGFEAQKRVFEAVLRSCAREGGKILSIHSVRCAGEVLKMIEACLPQDKGTAVLHWFTGSISEARRAVQLGCYFSINAEMLNSEPRRKLVASLPGERILTETDGPFTMMGACPSSPEDVATTVELLAKVLHLDLAVAKALIFRNLQRLEVVQT